MSKKAPHRNEPLILLTASLIAFAISGIQPYGQLIWFLETSPVLVGVLVLFLTYRRFPLTPLTYRLLFVHGLILVVGGHYTYARVPLGFTLQEWLGWERNPYDRIGHLAQGFFPAILIRELVVRHTPLRRGPWLWSFVIASCLAFSAFYEILEWWVAISTGDETADQFLGMQGDIWDTQWDMFLALVGAVFAVVFLSRRHQTELDQLQLQRAAVPVEN